MKKNSKNGAGFKALLAVLILTVAAVMAPLSHASSLEDVQLKVMNAIGSAARSNSADSGEGVMNIQYVGTGSDPIVTISATAMTFYSAATVVDGTIGTAGIVTFSSTPGASTLGGLCDLIEAETNYRCRLTGGKRDDLPILLRDQTAATGVRTLLGAGADLQFEGASTGGNGSAYVIRQGFTPPKGMAVVLRKCVAFNSGTGTLLVYGKLRAVANTPVAASPSFPAVVRDDTTLVWSEPTANAAALTADWSITGGVGGGIEFAKDAHVVVSAGNVATIQVAADYLRCGVEFR